MKKELESSQYDTLTRSEGTATNMANAKSARWTEAQDLAWLRFVAQNADKTITNNEWDVFAELLNSDNSLGGDKKKGKGARMQLTHVRTDVHTRHGVERVHVEVAFAAADVHRAVARS